MRVIVNADDLGASNEVNEAIFSLIASGRVRSTTVLANGIAFERAADEAKRLPKCSVGVHLNVTEFAPLTNHPGIKALLGSDGQFLGNIRRVRATPELREAVYGEWCAQVQRVSEAGLQVSHLDSHHHVHTIPALFPVLKRLQLRFGIRRVRISMNVYPDPAVRRWPLLAKKIAWNGALRHVFRSRTTDAFTSLLTFVQVGQSVPARYQSVELMVHPGAKMFAEENLLLASNWERKLPLAIEQISYCDL